MTATPLTEGRGLAQTEAGRRLRTDGPNAVPDARPDVIARALAKFWAPVPWMLEVAIILQLTLGEYVEAAAVALLLVFNAGLGYFQEGRAQATLDALKSRLAVTATVRRDGSWRSVPARMLVLGDVVKLSLGVVVPADVRLLDGAVLIDQSTLTGESMPVEAGRDFDSFAGALIRRGEALAEVIAIGVHTKFGQSAELIRTASVESTEQRAIFRVVLNLALFNGAVIFAIVTYCLHLNMLSGTDRPLVLVAILRQFLSPCRPCSRCSYGRCRRCGPPWGLAYPS